jgi:hypothetical protein
MGAPQAWYSDHGERYREAPIFPDLCCHSLPADYAPKGACHMPLVTGVRFMRFPRVYSSAARDLPEHPGLYHAQVQPCVPHLTAW